jgi:hypothetical protein
MVEVSLKCYWRVLIMILRSLQQELFIQCVFNLMAEKMANAIVEARS